MVNPVVNAANAFLIIWHHLPQPVTAAFAVSLILAVVWALFMIITK